jgi:hypothetical protein
MTWRVTLAVCAAGLLVAARLTPVVHGSTQQAEMIAYAGHGRIFDEKMVEIKYDPELFSGMQEAILEQVRKADAQPGDREAFRAAEEMVRSRQISVDEAILVRGAMISALLENAAEELQARYQWRSDAIIASHLRHRPELLATIRPELLELLRRIGFFEPEETSTSYMDDCRAHQVPIPPDWEEKGTAWVHQGSLTQNLLDPGGRAEVWTYADPKVEGACIALPRDDGGAGSPAGIICQSATTGHACFWDNKLRGVPEQFLGWAGVRLVIADLKDGSNLSQACTGCHQGNNVYLISPDDPTWGQVLRVVPTTDPTFTTQVRSSTDNRGGRPRYIPITTLPERMGWQNTFNPAGGVCAGCHEVPLAPVTPPPMPPACASAPGGCYRP